MQAKHVFHLWPRLHADLLELLEGTPEEALAPADGPGLADAFLRVAAVEERWCRAVLAEPPGNAGNPDRRPGDRSGLRERLKGVFTSTQELLRGSRVDALLERPIRTELPVQNALEALSLCYLHTIHHRAQIVLKLRAMGADVDDWV